MNTCLCHIYGKDGNPKCGECWSVLIHLIKDKNAMYITDRKTADLAISKAIQYDVTEDRGLDAD